MELLKYNCQIGVKCGKCRWSTQDSVHANKMVTFLSLKARG